MMQTPKSLGAALEALRHKEAELSYLKQQRQIVKHEVKFLRGLVEHLKEGENDGNANPV